MNHSCINNKHFKIENMKLIKQKKELKKIRAEYRMLKIHSEEYNLDVLFDCKLKNYSITVYVDNYEGFRDMEEALERIKCYIADDFAYCTINENISLTSCTLQSIQFKNLDLPF